MGAATTGNMWIIIRMDQLQGGGILEIMHTLILRKPTFDTSEITMFCVQAESVLYLLDSPK